MHIERAPRVFISYSWDDPQHTDRVLAFTQRLRADGVDAWIDRFTVFPPEGWPRWMRDQVEEADHVICVITSVYAERFSGRSKPNAGLGANWEGSIISVEIYQHGGRTDKFVPVVFSSSDITHIPHPLSQFSYFIVDQEDGYIALYRFLTRQPAFVANPVGAKRALQVLTQPVTLSSPQSEISTRRDRGNLPRLPYFYGRNAYLDAIAEALQPTRRTWGVLIDGPGGIGKTSLAIRAAELTSETEFARVIFVSSKSRELKPDGVHPVHDFLVPGYTEILNSLARELELDRVLRLDPKLRSEVLINALREIRVLLVIDNLESLHEEDRRRVFQFLGNLPEPSKAIVTSRRRTDVEARLIRLDRFIWDEAAALLRELSIERPLLARVSEEDRFALYQATGGNPLMLRWVAGQLGRGRCRNVQSALELLRSSPAGEEALEFIFGDLLDTFTNDETLLLGALTHFKNLIRAEHLAELADVGLPAALLALESLVDRALVSADAEMRQFVLTPLVAEFLGRARPEAVRVTGNRLANSAYAVVIENGYLAHERFPSLEAEWASIAAALPILAATQHRRFLTVCPALTIFLHYSGRWDELVILSRQAEETAVTAGDLRNARKQALPAGRVYFQRGQGQELLSLAERALSYVYPGHESERAEAVRFVGLAHRLLGDYSAALVSCREAYNLFKSISHESKDVAMAINSIAGIEHLCGNHEAAEHLYSEALSMAQRIGDHEAVGLYTGNLAELAIDRGELTKAEEFARTALDCLERYGRRDLIAAVRLVLARALAAQNRSAEAMGHIADAVEIFRDLRVPELSDAEKFRQSILEVMPQSQ